MTSKVILASLMVVGYAVGSTVYFDQLKQSNSDVAMRQMADSQASKEISTNHIIQSNGYLLGWLVVSFAVCCLFISDAKRLWQYTAKLSVIGFALFGAAGCYRPMEPIKLVEITAHEEAFLLPYLGDGSKQEASNNAEFLKKNLVYTKQVRIPQQWVPVGYEWLGPNGKWHDAGVLIKVDVSPVTREWTADKNSGTSKRDEAIWVMTSDSIEFSTGWTVTARIEGRDNAVKFLHNYRNGTLETIMDSEIRSKIQAEFGLEVTDLPMETLRKSATPHINKVIKTTKEFFNERGISITNIGITGGFIYKNLSILEKMVQVFNAEQEKDIAVSKTKAQEELNKAVILEAQGKADAILKTKKAEADGIKMLADAKFYELEKAKENTELYVKLKSIELQKDQLLKWDGRFPTTFIGSPGNTPNMLLQMPATR